MYLEKFAEFGTRGTLRLPVLESFALSIESLLLMEMTYNDTCVVSGSLFSRVEVRFMK